jgi:hypothetical protein
MANKKINQLDVRTSPSLTDLLAIADPSSGYAYKITGSSLQTLLSDATKVPYTGATASVNLGEFGLTAGQLTLDTSPTGTAVVGTTQWNDTIGSSQTLLKGGNVLLKNGVDLVARVVNKVTPSTTLTKAAYKAVRVSGAQGQRLAVAYAQANTDNNSADTIGLVCETIAANQEGFIITVGQLLEVNTTGSLQGETWADGDVLYLSPTTAGNLTNIKPTGATGHIVVIGYVEYAHSVHGSIYVKVMNGWELDELHNVYINAVANNQVLTYESATELWKNKSIATILGYTPQAAITLTTTGSSGAATFVSNTLNIPTVTLAGLGGASDSLVMHLAGTETATGVKTFSIGLATTTGDNFLNTSSGNTYVGYSAVAASPQKLNVLGNANIEFTANRFLYLGVRSGYSDIAEISTTNATYLQIKPSGLLFLYPQDSSSTIILGSNLTKQNLTASALYGSSSAAGYGFNGGTNAAQVWKANIDSGGGVIGNFIFHGSDFGAFVHRITTTSAAIHTLKTTGQLQLHNYTSTTSFTGTVAGLLGFDASGNIITTAASGGGISGSGTAGQVTYWSGTSDVTGSATFTYTPTSVHLLNNSVTAATAIARGMNITSTLIAAANNDVLVGLDIAPTFTTGAFTGVKNYAVRMSGPLYISNTTALTSSPLSIEMNPSGTGTNNNLNIEFRNTNATSNKVQFILGGGTIASGYSRIWSFGVDPNGTGIKDFYIYNGSTSKLPFIITANENFILGNQTTNTTYTDSNYRLDINGTGATAGALRVTGGNVQFGSATGLNWDNTNARLGIGTSSPNVDLHISKNVATDYVDFLVHNSNTGTSDLLQARIVLGTGSNITSTNTVKFGITATGSSYTGNAFFWNARNSSFMFATNNTEKMRLWNTGNLLIQASGTFTDAGYRLDVNGTGATAGALRVTGGLSLFQGGKMTIAAATTSYASLNIPSGTAPTTPANGDMWNDGTNVYFRIGGTTKTFTFI